MISGVKPVSPAENHLRQRFDYVQFETMLDKSRGLNVRPTIITFSGKAMAGKDTAADFLAKQATFRGWRVLRMNYADQLKYLARQYLGWNGEKDAKGRTLLQTLGTEKVRNRFPNYWVDTTIGVAKIFQHDYDYIIIGDCRFSNEVSRWSDEGFSVITVHVERPDFDNGLTHKQKQHPSETALDDFKFDYYIHAETPKQLEDAVSEFARRYLY